MKLYGNGVGVKKLCEVKNWLASGHGAVLLWVTAVT